MAKTFDVIANVIYYDNIAFATINGKAWPHLEAQAIDALESYEEDSPLAYTQEEVDEAYSNGYQEAEEVMLRTVDRLEDKIEQLEEELNGTK
jgi:hypothetical protein